MEAVDYGTENPVRAKASSQSALTFFVSVRWLLRHRSPRLQADGYIENPSLEVVFLCSMLTWTRIILTCHTNHYAIHTTYVHQLAMQIYVGYNQIVQHLPWNPQFAILDSLTAEVGE